MEISQAEAIKAFTVKSPGTMLAFNDPSQCIDRSNPPPAPAATPVGPYILSIQPEIGSLYVETTRDNKKSQVSQENINRICIL